MTTLQQTFEFFPPRDSDFPSSPPVVRQAYVAECERRWHGMALRDALTNFADFQRMRAALTNALRTYKRNPFLEDLSGKCHNPDGTLTALLWKLQAAWEPDRSCLMPLLDFEEHFQKVFLRRGLIIYCGLILKSIEGGGA